MVCYKFTRFITDRRSEGCLVQKQPQRHGDSFFDFDLKFIACTMNARMYESGTFHATQKCNHM
jgi:hypothetical protein